ncbi:hypothetical protein [Acidithiobacillus sulfuriphilus]|uniref:hypothetical protein n=1 Tax=Acidithiobacillus sulfuriphilus TaxID=1867749 RepID=UPI003F60E402
MQGHKVTNNRLKEKTVTATQMTYACVFLISVLSPVTAYAENTDLKQGAEQAGQTVGSTVHKIGQTGKEVGLGIAHGAVDIGHAAKAGAIEFWKAVKGDTGTTGNTRSQN